MAFTSAQESEIRRMLGFAALGVPSSSNPLIASLLSAYRVLDPTSALENRFMSLTQDEEVQVLGSESASFVNYIAPVVPPCISWTNSDTSLVVYGFVPTIRVLEGDLIGKSRDNLGYDVADVITFRKTELGQRNSLVNKVRLDLATLLFVPLDPDLLGHGKRSGGRGRFRRV
jgi:hypothetical protein